MKIVLVSSYPPRPCGVGAYAWAQVDRLRRNGHQVIVISPPDGDGDIRTAFGNGSQFHEAARRGVDADRIIVHFQPAVHYRRGSAAILSRIRTSLALLALVRRRPQVEILVHEATPRPSRWRPNQRILARVFAKARLSFHTDVERRALERDYGIRVRAELVDHREGIQANTMLSKHEARRRLGLDTSEPLFVCIGFLNPWKGFDRAIRAFTAAGAPGRLTIVGFLRDPVPENVAFADQLRALVEEADRVSLVDGFLEDEAFDLWMVAADRLVLPYVRAWSSGVLARASVLGTPAFVSDVGGLPEQAGPDDELFSSDEELRELFARFRADADR